jgi:MFS family permease
MKHAIKRIRLFAALRFPQFRIFFLGSSLGSAAYPLMNITMMWQLYNLTHSPVSLGLIGVFSFIPVLLFSMIGGVAADVWDRKVILIVCRCILASVALLFAITSFTHIISPAIIYLCLCILAAVDAFNQPARSSIMVTLVPQEYFSNAVALNSTMWQTLQVLVPGLAGFFIWFMGVEKVYLLSSLLYILGTITYIFLIIPPLIHHEKPDMSLKTMKEGVKFVVKEPLIYSTMLLDFAATFFASANSLLPIYAADIFKVGPKGLGMLYGASSVGAIIAGLITSGMHKIPKQGTVLIAAVGMFGVTTMIFGFATSFWIGIICLALAGACDMTSVVIRNVVRQLVTPNTMRGRMTSIDMIFYMGGPLLGETEAGFLAKAVGTPFSVFVGGAATVCVAILVAIFVPTLRKYDPKTEIRAEL